MVACRQKIPRRLGLAVELFRVTLLIFVGLCRDEERNRKHAVVPSSHTSLSPQLDGFNRGAVLFGDGDARPPPSPTVPSDGGADHGRRADAARPAPTGRPLPPSSVGYRLLAKAGWRPGQGLGAAGQGATLPVAAAAVAGTAGLGAPRRVAAEARAADAPARRLPAGPPPRRRPSWRPRSARATRRTPTGRRGRRSRGRWRASGTRATAAAAARTTR